MDISNRFIIVCNIQIVIRMLKIDQSITNLLRKSMDWFLYDNGLRHERVNYHAPVKVHSALISHSVTLLVSTHPLLANMLMNKTNDSGKAEFPCYFL